jgi:hypothetical protein
MGWIKKEILLPSDFESDDSELVGEEIINFIIKRSKQGKGVDGTPFPKYSKEYMNSLDFKNAGKSSKVNLTLSSEMLDSLQVLSAKKGKVVIGFEKGDTRNNAVAEGNILGSYGQQNANPSKARNFMELSDGELASVLRKVDVLPKEVMREIAKEAKAGAYEIIDRFKFDLEIDDGENA